MVDYLFSDVLALFSRLMNANFDNILIFVTYNDSSQ